MLTPKADLILHPVRMRIIMALAGEQMTARQIAALLPDVAPATLYRHLNTLTEGGILAVVEQHPVRGTVEKVYALASPQAAHLSQADTASMDTEGLMHLFTAFVVTLLGDFSRYLGQANINLAKDGVGFHKYPLYLNDEEFMAFGKRLNELMVPFLENSPSPDRRRRLFSLILMPDPDEPGSG